MASARLTGNRRAVLRGLRRGQVQVTPSQQVGAYCGFSSAQRAGSPGQELTTQSTDQPANGTLHLIRAWQGYGSGAIDGLRLYLLTANDCVERAWRPATCLGETAVAPPSRWVEPGAIVAVASNWLR